MSELRNIAQRLAMDADGPVLTAAAVKQALRQGCSPLSAPTLGMPRCSQRHVTY